MEPKKRNNKNKNKNRKLKQKAARETQASSGVEQSQVFTKATAIPRDFRGRPIPADVLRDLRSIGKTPVSVYPSDSSSDGEPKSDSDDEVIMNPRERALAKARKRGIKGPHVIEIKGREPIVMGMALLRT